MFITRALSLSLLLDGEIKLERERGAGCDVRLHMLMLFITR